MPLYELSAVRARPGEDIGAAINRVEDFAGKPVTDEVWDEMASLARGLLDGFGTLHVKDDRTWVSRQASVGSLMIDVLQHGHLVNVYFNVGPGQSLGPLDVLLTRLRSQGFTIVNADGESIVEAGRDLTEYAEPFG